MIEIKDLDGNTIFSSKTDALRWALREALNAGVKLSTADIPLEELEYIAAESERLLTGLRRVK